MTSATATTNKQWILKSRPAGPIQDDTFAMAEGSIPEIGEGQILCRNLYLSLDPAMRGWISDAESYSEPVELDSVMRGACIGEVIESKNDGYAVGDKVYGLLGWQEYAAAGPEELPNKLPGALPIPLTAFLSVLGLTGITAYFGLNEIGQPKEGDTVLVSTAAGAVGSIVGQLAKLKGCRVVGIAGSDEKCAWITDELGFDAAINYKSGDVAAKIREACPDRIDVYFDNVGGEMLNAALAHLNIGARIVICGAIQRFNRTDELPGPANYINLLAKRATMRGFVVIDYRDRFMEAIGALAPLVLSKKLKFREHVVDGLENAPKAILKLYDGTNSGKLIIKIADPT